MLPAELVPKEFGLAFRNKTLNQPDAAMKLPCGKKVDVDSAISFSFGTAAQLASTNTSSRARLHFKRTQDYAEAHLRHERSDEQVQLGAASGVPF